MVCFYITGILIYLYGIEKCDKELRKAVNLSCIFYILNKKFKKTILQNI